MCCIVRQNAAKRCEADSTLSLERGRERGVVRERQRLFPWSL